MSIEINRESLLATLAVRPEDAHKGTFGHLLLLAGSRGFTGAARLAGEAAGRSGVGLVTVGIPRPLADIAAVMLLEAMSLPLPSTPEETFAFDALEPALEAASTRTAVALGPGISQHPDTRRFVLEFVARCPVPLVVDADGLNCLSHAPDTLGSSRAPVVVTPHPGEMARLAGCSTAEVQRDREGTAVRFAKRHGCVVVLKGHRTAVATADGTCHVNPTGNSGMATGGSGDVLTGLMGGLLAQRMDAAEAARLAVYLHGRAGDHAAQMHTARGMMARDITAALPAAWREMEGEAER